MLFIALIVSLLPFIVSCRIYEIEISVDDEYQWTVYNNASVYFILITNRDGMYIETPAYVIQDGLPDSKIYHYSLLLDDVGDVYSLKLMHTDANTLCIDWISVDNKTVTDADRNYDCKSDEYYDCQQITVYFESKTIYHSYKSFAASGCNWNEIIARGLLKEYNVEITLDSSHEVEFYNRIGILFEGFVFDSYYTPYYNLSSDIGKIYDIYNYDKIEFSIVTYDITPIQSLVITNSNPDTLCVKRVEISVTNAQLMNVDKIFSQTQCVSYSDTNINSNGCNVLSLDFRNDKSSAQTQSNCDISLTSFSYNNANRADTTKYKLSMQVSEGTSDYIFYQMEGHTGGKTECFNTAGFQLPTGKSMHEYGYMKNVGNPKILYLLHDRNDDICIQSISVYNERTNDTITHTELMCSRFLYDENDKGRCNVITIDFETDIASNTVYQLCPFDELCEFGLYEDPYSSKMSGAKIAVIVVFLAMICFVILSFVFGYKCLWCNCVYLVLLNCWDPFVDKIWNPKCAHKCCYCSNSTDMQHNMCCYCCGCNYCNPFSIHRRRMDKKNANAIRKGKNIDEYDTEDGHALNLTTHKNDKYDMGSMDNIDLGDNIAHMAGDGGGNGNGHTNNDNNMDDIDDELGDIAVDFDDSDSTELQLNINKNQYSSLNVEDAPINMGMYSDNDNIGTAVVDHYDNPELR